MILSNIAQVKNGDFALDPFVGTASILVALSHFGCQCFGTDIDIRILKGDMYAGHKPANKNTKKNNIQKRNIFENFIEYGLVRPEIIRLDNHLLERHYKIRPNLYLNNNTNNREDGEIEISKSHMYEGMFEVIVTDPPYGIRAGECV